MIGPHNNEKINLLAPPLFLLVPVPNPGSIPIPEHNHHIHIIIMIKISNESLPSWCRRPCPHNSATSV